MLTLTRRENEMLALLKACVLLGFVCVNTAADSRYVVYCGRECIVIRVSWTVMYMYIDLLNKRKVNASIFSIFLMYDTYITVQCSTVKYF